MEKFRLKSLLPKLLRTLTLAPWVVHFSIECVILQHRKCCTLASEVIHFRTLGSTHSKRCSKAGQFEKPG